MRRLSLAVALLLAVILQQTASASVPRYNSVHSHRASAAYRRHSSRVGRVAGRRSRHRAAPSEAALHRRAQRTSLAHVRRLRRLRERSNSEIASLDPENPTVQAKIDPVPLSRFRIPKALKGTHESLVRQNVRAEADGLLRIEDDDALLALREDKSLVALPINDGLRVDQRLAANRRYCRPWTAHFLADVARVHYGRFHHPLQVNSAVRTVAYQRTLGRVNGNAAAADGDIASPHLTGATIDIAKKGLSMQEIGWMRAFLLPMQTAGKLDVEEEFHQACFHITVYKSYLAPQQEMAKANPASGAALLAAKVR